MREVIFDTETTGLDPKTGDRMVEIGCVEMVGRVETGRTFHAYFNPERDMPAAAEAVHGLSIQFLSDKPLFATRVDDLMEFLGDAPLIARRVYRAAHNVGHFRFVESGSLDDRDAQRAIHLPQRLPTLPFRFRIDQVDQPLDLADQLG